MSVSSILGVAAALYRLLFRRSVAIAAVVYAVIALVDLAADQLHGPTAGLLLGLLAFSLRFAGPVLVQGALVQIVRNIHEGERPEAIGALFRSAGSRIGSLVWASIVYGLGVGFGLLFFVVPGLLAAARWCLMAPLIMLENADAREARHFSSSMVRGKTATVLAAVVVSFVLTSAGSVFAYVAGLEIGDFCFVAFEYAWASITAPFAAHVLTVIYYNLADPERPVIHPDVRTWKSVWSGER